MDYDIDEVRVIEGPRRLVEHLVAEVPRRRPHLPEQPTETSTIGGQARPTPLGVEVPLVPERAFRLGRRRSRWCDRILDRIAADEYGRAHATRMKRRSNACGATTPVIPGYRKTLKTERVGQVDEILSDRSLLGHPGR